MQKFEKLKIEVTIKQSIEDVWRCMTEANHITEWYFASDDWHAPSAQIDFKIGGSFKIRMEAKDGSMGFDFEGIYDAIINYEKIKYHLEDNRTVEILFRENNGKVIVTEMFDAETENPLDMQRQGWQAILDNFKKYVESQ